MGHGCVRQTAVDHPLRSGNLTPGEMHFGLTVVSVIVVQHIRHWRAMKIVHVKIAVADPSLSLRQGKAPTNMIVLVCVACEELCPVRAAQSMCCAGQQDEDDLR